MNMISVEIQADNSQNQAHFHKAKHHKHKKLIICSVSSKPHSIRSSDSFQNNILTPKKSQNISKAKKKDIKSSFFPISSPQKNKSKHFSHVQYLESLRLKIAEKQINTKTNTNFEPNPFRFPTISTPQTPLSPHQSNLIHHNFSPVPQYIKLDYKNQNSIIFQTQKKKNFRLSKIILAKYNN